LHHIFYISGEQINVTLFAFFEKENWSARLIQALYSLKDMTEVIFGRDIGKFWQILIPFTMKSLKFSALSFLYFLHIRDWGEIQNILKMINFSVLGATIWNLTIFTVNVF